MSGRKVRSSEKDPLATVCTPYPAKTNVRCSHSSYGTPITGRRAILYNTQEPNHDGTVAYTPNVTLHDKRLYRLHDSRNAFGCLAFSVLFTVPHDLRAETRLLFDLLVGTSNTAAPTISPSDDYSRHCRRRGWRGSPTIHQKLAKPLDKNSEHRNAVK